MHAVTTRAADGVRSGEGPALIEAVTYRMAGHSTSDDPQRYRSVAELDHWRTLDPLDRLRRLLEDRTWADPGYFEQLDQEAADLAADVRRVCRAMPDPAPEAMFEHVLVTETPALRAEREAYAAYSATFVD